MTIPSKLRVAGAVTIGPVQPSGSFPSGQSVSQLNFERIVNAHSGVRAISVNSPTPGFFDLMANLGFTQVTFAKLRVRTGSFVVDVTTSAGANQVFDLSDLWLVNNPIPGTEITGLRIQGVGDLEVTLAGDP